MYNTIFLCVYLIITEIWDAALESKRNYVVYASEWNV